MSIKVNYLTVRDSSKLSLGQIEFFDYYIETSKNFPYLNLNQKNIILQYLNWPELVPYLYDLTFDIIDGETLVNTFYVSSMSINQNNATLNFTEPNAIKIITALNEDREMFYTDNGSYGGWNKTFTPINDIAYNNITYFASENNFYISDILINSNSVSIKTTASQSSVFSDVSLSNISIEFGQHRIPGQIKSGQNFNGNVFFAGFNGKYLCNDNKNNFLNGLNVKSQIMGHSHTHTHSLNDHTHGFNHRHGMSNHTHNMAHSHAYRDSKSTSGNVYVGTSGAFRATQVSPLPTDIYKETAFTDKITTDGPNINISNQANVSVTDSIDRNLTSNIIYNRVITPDDLKSNADNLKVSSKVNPESYTIYAYMYGKKYII